ncbi:MAG: BolA/IbaG family iron-sulfur metabolism protein [Pseudomonadota bacterium]
MVTPEDIEGWIRNGLAETTVSVTGDGAHFEAIIINAAFEGKSLIQRHQMVYGALGDKMKAEIHALSMKTLTPAEHGNQ